MKKAIIISGIFLLLFAPFSVNAGSKDKIERIQEYVENALELYDIPGASLAIVKNGEITYQDNWGNSSEGSPVTSDTPFLIGSLSKPITALATLMLVEEGKIKLDEPIQTYIPSFNYQTDSSKEITVLNLLKQTSGISEYDGLKVTDKSSTDEGAMKRSVKELSGVRLSNDPGEVYEYNSANYLLLGAIIEEVTGQTYSAFINRHIFTPLAMDDSAADYKSVVEQGFVRGFESWFGKPVEGDGLYDNSGAPYGYIASSSSDLAEFLLFMLEGGDLLTEKSLKLLKTPPEEIGTYGMGWRFAKSGNFPWHGGATPNFRAEMFFIPEQNYGAVLLTNKYHIFEDVQVSNIMEGIRSILNGDNPEELPAPNHMIQWVMLGVTLLLAILTVVHFSRIKNQRFRRKRVSITVGVLSIVLAIGLIPLFVYSVGVPWRTFSLFAPDLAFLITCIVTIFALNGILIGTGFLVRKTIASMEVT